MLIVESNMNICCKSVWLFYWFHHYVPYLFTVIYRKIPFQISWLSLFVVLDAYISKHEYNKCTHLWETYREFLCQPGLGPDLGTPAFIWQEMRKAYKVMCVSNKLCDGYQGKIKARNSVINSVPPYYLLTFTIWTFLSLTKIKEITF